MDHLLVLAAHPAHVVIPVIMEHGDYQALIRVLALAVVQQQQSVVVFCLPHPMDQQPVLAANPAHAVIPVMMEHGILTQIRVPYVEMEHKRGQRNAIAVHQIPILFVIDVEPIVGFLGAETAYAILLLELNSPLFVLLTV